MSLNEPEDERWISELQRGEDAAVAQLYRLYARPILGWVLRLGGPYLDHEDVAQEVFLRAIELLPRYRREAPLRSFLFGVTRRVVANARRRATLRRFLGLDTLPDLSSGAAGSDETLDQLRRRRQVQLALETLPTHHREVLVLVDLEERSAIEAAELLGIPVGTVYSRLHHARRSFTTAIDPAALAPAALGAR